MGMSFPVYFPLNFGIVFKKNGLLVATILIHLSKIDIIEGLNTLFSLNTIKTAKVGLRISW